LMRPLGTYFFWVQEFEDWDCDANGTNDQHKSDAGVT
jgi:hypothetical protein